MKITRTTLKSFIKKNKDNLFVKVKSSFDGMIDGVRDVEMDWKKVEAEPNFNERYNYGIQGIWVVGESRDYLTEYEDENYKGIRISNCCGVSIIATKK